MIAENHERSDCLGAYRPPGSEITYRLYVFRGDQSLGLEPDLLAYWDEESLQYAKFTDNIQSREVAVALYVAYLLNSKCQGRLRDPQWDNLVQRYLQEFMNVVVVSH